MSGINLCYPALRGVRLACSRCDTNSALKTVRDELQEASGLRWSTVRRAAVHSNGIQFLSYLFRREAGWVELRKVRHDGS